MPAGASREYGNVAVPEKCTADFCLIPLGTADASVSKQIAEVQRLVRGHPDVETGKVNWTMHSAGTTLEGPWTNVMTIIGQAHQVLHEQGIVRIQTDIRVGSRTDKKQTAKDKVDVVERLLAGDNNSSSMEEPGMVRSPSVESTYNLLTSVCSDTTKTRLAMHQILRHSKQRLVLSYRISDPTIVLQSCVAIFWLYICAG